MKKNQILTAATDLFMRLGFDAVRMDAVANEAKVSKATVYVYFANKQELFGAVLSTYLQQSTVMHPKLPTGPASNIDELSTVLLKFLQDGLNYFNNDKVIKLYRLLISEIHKFPDLFLPIFGDEIKQTTSVLADYLQRYKTVVEDRESYYILASQIMDLLRGASLWVNLVQNPLKQELFCDAEKTITVLHSATMSLVFNFYKTR